MSEHFSWSSLLLILFGVYGVIGGYLYFFQNDQVFHPPKGLTFTPEQWGMTYESVDLMSEGNRLLAWWIAGEEKEPVVLFFHGNASSIESLQSYVYLFHTMGMGVLVFDYRGYGVSEGKPTEEGVYEDSLAAWKHLVKERGIAENRLVYYGHSLGGGAATWLAVQHPPKALILEGTFTSIPDLGSEIYPWLPVRFLSRIQFNNFERVQRIQSPLMIIHSPEDEVIKFMHAKKLYAAAREPKTLLKSKGSHNDGFVSMEKSAQEQLKRFLSF